MGAAGQDAARWPVKRVSSCPDGCSMARPADDDSDGMILVVAEWRLGSTAAARAVRSG